MFRSRMRAAIEAARPVADAAVAPVPLLKCSETIREAIRVGNPHAAGLAAGLASYARSKGFPAFVAADAAASKGYGEREVLLSRAAQPDERAAKETK